MIFYDTLEKAMSAKKERERTYIFRHASVTKFANCLANSISNGMTRFAQDCLGATYGLADGLQGRGKYINRLQDENAALKAELAALRNGNEAKHDV